MPTIKVDGMQCAHCKKSVEEAVSALPGIKCAQADLGKKELAYENSDASSPADMDMIMKTIRKLGFEPKS